MKYVVHFCQNKECNNSWIDKDLTNVKTFPPTWKYCKECCNMLGIDFDSQKPGNSTSEEQKEVQQKNKERRKNNKNSF